MVASGKVPLIGKTATAMVHRATQTQVSLLPHYVASRILTNNFSLVTSTVIYDSMRFLHYNQNCVPTYLNEPFLFRQANIQK